MSALVEPHLFEIKTDRLNDVMKKSSLLASGSERSYRHRLLPRCLAREHLFDQFREPSFDRCHQRGSRVGAAARLVTVYERVVRRAAEKPRFFRCDFTPNRDDLG